MGESAVRPPAHAGTFYEANPKRLRAEVERYLEAAGEPPGLGVVHGIVSPHAGYIFSGPPAAFAYRAVQGKGYERAVIFAPSHVEWFDGVATFLGDEFATPLGGVPIDRVFVQRLIEVSPHVNHMPGAHSQEHSLEVQLPFLQVVLPGIELVPLLMAKQSWATVSAAADAVAGCLDTRPTLVIASSDLYHGDDYEECKASDERLARALEQFDPRGFLAGLEAGEYQACGPGPIAAAMAVAKRMGATKATTLKLTNSHETYYTGGRHVVGYLAAAFHSP